jgi:hypothetical protein
MNKQQYNRETIDIFFRENREQHEEIKQVLNSINERVGITNGKVAEVSKWKEKINGGLYVIAFLGFSGFIAIILWWIKLFT